MKHFKLALVLALAAPMSWSPLVNAEPGKTGGIGRMEGSRDMNILQVEPSIINEAYYTSGRAEHHQYVGNVLPAGAPIPDVDEPLSKQKQSAPAKPDAEIKAPECKNQSPTKPAGKTKAKSAQPGLRKQFVGKVLPAGAAIPDSE